MYLDKVFNKFGKRNWAGIKCFSFSLILSSSPCLHFHLYRRSEETHRNRKLDWQWSYNRVWWWSLVRYWVQHMLQVGSTVGVCLAGDLIRQHMAVRGELGAHIWGFHTAEVRDTQTLSTVQICTKPSTQAYRYMLAHGQSLTRICCCSSAVLWAMWRLWRCKGKEALEAPTRLLPNGRIDIYPGRLWLLLPQKWFNLPCRI